MFLFTIVFDNESILTKSYEGGYWTLADEIVPRTCLTFLMYHGTK